MTIAGERHHRHAHPQGIAARRRPVIGKRVEGDIELAVGGEIVGRRRQPGQRNDAIGGDAVRGEEREIAPPARRIGGLQRFEQQARARDPVQNPRP
jgi:hypothetical protein